MSLLVNWQRVLCLGGQGAFPEAPLCARARPSTGNRGDTPTSTSCVSLSTVLLSPEKWHFLPKARLIHSWVQGSWFLPPGMYSSKTSIFGESISWFCCLVECGCEIIFSSENGGRWRASCTSTASLPSEESSGISPAGSEAVDSPRARLGLPSQL